MQKRKVLYIITKSNLGGAQRYVLDLATHLPPHYEVVAAVGGTGEMGATPGLLKERLEAAGVRTIVVPSFLRNISLANDLRTLLTLVRVVRQERPAVLHVTSSKAGGLGAVAGRLCGVRHIVFTSHGLTFDEVWRPWWQRVLIYSFTWLTMFLAHRTIMISRSTYERARRMPLVGKRVHLVLNGVILPTQLPRDTARQALVPHTAEAVDAQQWVGTIAEYHPNKNLRLLIETTALLCPHYPQIHLVLIGDGELHDQLLATAQECKVSNRVHCIGYKEQAAQYLQAFDIFVLPSQKEGLPYVLIEAGLAKLPVVVSDIPGNTEVITHEKTGLVVEPTPTALAAALTRLLEHPDERATFASALHQDVTHRFSIEHMVQDTLEVYE